MRRRTFSHALFALLGAASLPATAASANPRIVIVGGGFAGVTVARNLQRLLPAASITLVERSPTYTACPFSNLVVAGERKLTQQQFSYRALEQQGITLRIASATDVDAAGRRVILGTGEQLPYDRLVMSPGIALNYDALPGYSSQGAQHMPHAWLAGAQTALLHRRLRALPQGGLVVIAAPENPYRCPPGPYERASLMAHYLKQHNPSAKLLVLDAKDKFSKQALFTQGWREHYGDLLEWQGSGDGGRVRAVQPERGVVETDFDTFKPDLANVIPPQRAADIAVRAGLTDASGWCPIDTMTFASTRHADIHVLGDASIANAMPKSAFAANAQGKICAVQLARLLTDQPPVSTKLINTCYSLLTPDRGITVAGVYYPDGQRFAEVSSAGGVSALDPPPGTRALEAEYAYSWFDTLTAEVFG